MPELVWINESFRILPVHGVRLGAGSVHEKRDTLAGQIAAGKPDLALFNGDTFGLAVSEDEARVLLCEFVRPLAASRIPFTFTLGEGDRKCGLSDKVLMDIFSSTPGCVHPEYAEGIDGISNGTVPVCRPGREKPALILRLFDTHCETTSYEQEYGSPGRSRLPYPLYTPHYMDGVRFNQTIWFDEDADRLAERYGSPIPEVFFFHTPTPEHAELPLNQDRGGFDGMIREARRCQTVNGGIGMAAAESRRVLGIICGHEETNDYFADWAGMKLGVEPAFGRGAWIVSLESPDSTRLSIIRIR